MAKYFSAWSLENSEKEFYIGKNNRITFNKKEARLFSTESEAEDHAVEWAYTSSHYSVYSAGYSIESC